MFAYLTRRESAVLVLVIAGVAILYALVRGRVFLMPYSVRREDNPRAFSVLLAFIVFAFGSAAWTLARR